MATFQLFFSVGSG